jgi:hypothetical protein
MEVTMITLADIETRYGSADSAFVHEQITALYDEIDDPCIDNVRFALVGDPQSECDYDAARDTGCCGSVDRRVGPSPSGRFYMIGFNYGH